MPDDDNGNLKVSFEPIGVTIGLDKLLPMKPISGRTRQGSKYAAIRASIKEVGIIEPPVVFPSKKVAKGKPKTYIILDGHLRIDILKALGHESVFCLISTDDEAFTFNHKVNHISAIQAHFMIVKVINSGVPEEKIAKALDIDVSRIIKQRDLLTGICPEAVALLHEKPITASALRLLRRVKPLRQMEIAELLICAGNYCSQYVTALVLATPAVLLDKANQPKTNSGVSPEGIARMQREMQSLELSVREIEDNYGPNMMNLVLTRAYLAKLVANKRVKRYLASRHAGFLVEFEKIIETSSLDG